MTAAMAIMAAGAERTISRGKILWAYVFVGLAVLAKGPVAFVLAAGIMLFFWFLDDRRIVPNRGHIVPGFAIAAALSVPWFWLAFQQNGYAFIATFFINHNIARFVTDIHLHSQPFYYYLPALMALMFPWSGWLPALISKSPLEGLRRWRQWDPKMVFLSCWTLFPLFFFSLSDSKLAGYILPSLPPLALILGSRLSRWMEGTVESSGLRAAMILQLLFSAAMAAAAPVFFHRDYGGNWKAGLMLSAAILVPALFAFGFGIGGHCRRAFKATVLQALLVIIAATQFAFPILADYHSTRDIARLALELRREAEPIITYGFFHHTLNYYTDYRVGEKLDDPEAAINFGRKYPHFLLVTDTRRMPEVLNLQGFSVSILEGRGNVRLLRFAGR